MRSFRARLAMGDPQAPFTTVLEILDRAGVLSEQGTLSPDVQLVSMGDHFDWGPPSARQRVATDGIALLSWLAAHGPEQIILLLGNHDLARVGDLEPFHDDAAYESAQAQADRAYRLGKVDREAEAKFLEDFPFLPDAESLARDYSTFTTEQARQVELLLRSGRFRLAFECAGLLLVHAGVTRSEFEAAGIDSSSAASAAAGLNALLDERVGAWSSGPLGLQPLHQSASAVGGLARGVLIHRPADPARVDPRHFEGPPRRRFDPRELPGSFPQVIGHIRDDKCRELMPDWCEEKPVGDGPLRSLVVDGDSVRYAGGCAQGARLYFTDGGMAHARPGTYQLLDLDTRRPYGA
jgi:hypothetical protein